MQTLIADLTMSLDGFIAGPARRRGRAGGARSCTRVIQSPTVTHLRYRALR